MGDPKVRRRESLSGPETQKAEGLLHRRWGSAGSISEKRREDRCCRGTEPDLDTLEETLVDPGNGKPGVHLSEHHVQPGDVFRSEPKRELALALLSRDPLLPRCVACMSPLITVTEVPVKPSRQQPVRPYCRLLTLLLLLFSC